MCDDAIDGKCVSCSAFSFGSICITEGMEGKFIDDDDLMCLWYVELEDRGKAGESKCLRRK